MTAARPLLFFTDPLGLNHQPFVPMLHPFLGLPKIEVRDPSSAKFQSYYAAARGLFAPAERAAAEIAVLPWDWNRVRDDPMLRAPARRFIRDNAAAGLKTLVFSESDPETAPHEPGMLLFRTSLLGEKLQPHEHALPAWVLFEPDLTLENLPLRKFNPKPAVGFCGASYRKNFKPPNWFRRTFRPWRCQYERVFPRPPGLRGHILDLLRATPRLDTNIIERHAFFGGAAQNGKLNIEAFLIARCEYVENLLGSDYALCVRGGGNFSYRFYDALQMGRIPLFINTDCVLPWPQCIPWRKLCVWVERAELHRLEEILLAHHAALGPSEFAERQRQCRAVWEKHLSPLGFFTTLRAWLADPAQR